MQCVRNPLTSQDYLPEIWICYDTWLEQLIGVLRNANPIPALRAGARREVQNVSARSVSACDVVFLVRDSELGRTRMGTGSHSTAFVDHLSS